MRLLLCLLRARSSHGFILSSTSDSAASVFFVLNCLGVGLLLCYVVFALYVFVVCVVAVGL